MIRGTVLVIEDDGELIDLMKMRLESAGHQVIMASNGEEALQVARAKTPDVVVLDVFLPDMDGLTVLKRLKAPVEIETGKPSKTKDIPVIVITGKAPMIENITRVEGAVDFFVKPFDAKKLIDRVCHILEQAKDGQKHEQKSKR